MTDAPLWTTEICGRCNANQSALITLAQGQGRRWLESEALADKVQQILDRAMECPECKEVLREKNQEDIMEVTKSIGGDIMSLSNQVATVAGLRGRVAGLKDRVTELRTAWELANKPLLDCLAQEASVLAQAEEALRDATIEAFEASGRTSKAPAPGVGIRVGTKLEYDPKTALSWAREHGICLALDVKSFEKLAKATPIDFVHQIETVTATIATDLSQYYPAPEAK